jgi:hypothetical protein
MIDTFNQIEHNKKIERLEGELLLTPQVECDLKHIFAPGVYYREIFMPAGSLIIGHEHKTEHLNIVLSGFARVMMNDDIVDIASPDVFISKPGTRKVLLIIEDMRWGTVHPTEETNMEVLEKLLIKPSDTFQSHKAIMENAMGRLS